MRVLGPAYRRGRQSFGLIVSEEYLVFGLRILDGQPWVDIANDTREPRYLFSAPLCLFEIIDGSVPALWVARVVAHLQVWRARCLRRSEY